MVTKVQPFIHVVVVGNRYVGDCCAGRSMAGQLSVLLGRYGSHEGLPRSLKRLANWVLSTVWIDEITETIGSRPGCDVSPS